MYYRMKNICIMKKLEIIRLDYIREIRLTKECNALLI